MSLSDSRLSSFSLYPWNPGIASSIFSWRLVWDLARSKYGLVVELKLSTLLIVKNEISPDSLLRVSKPDNHKNRNEIIFLIDPPRLDEKGPSFSQHRISPTSITTIGKGLRMIRSDRPPRSGLSGRRLQNDYVH